MSVLGCGVAAFPPVVARLADAESLGGLALGVGGGFLTFPIFVYTLGVSSMTTVGTDIFQIVFTAGYAAISQYAIYGFIFYTLAMGMLIGSLFGVQVGAMVTNGSKRPSEAVR